MKRKFTFLIAAAVMLLTMMATTGTMWGQTRTTQTASYGFETGDSGWTATSCVTNNTAITAHGGSKYGATNGGSTANVAYNTIVANPQSLTCYYSKTTTNTNAGSHFEIQVSTNNSTWTTVESGLGMDKVTKGTWYELTADLSSYSNVYVRVYYTGTSAVRALDDITLTYDDGQSPSTDPVISFSPTSVTLGDVLTNNETSTTFTVSQSNLEEGITLNVDNGELSQTSIDKDADPISITWTYTPTTAGAISATVTATSGETSQTLEISGTAIAPVEGYDVDFEYATNMYPNWEFVNMTTLQTGSVTAHGGTHYGTTGGKSTASVTTESKVANPGTLTCYVTKQSGNTTASSWYIQVSSDGSSWTNVETQDATSMSQGTWVEFSADLSSYSDVYVRVYYSGSTAIRNIDDISLTEASNALSVTYNGNGNTGGTVPTDDNEYESGDEVTVLGNTDNLAKAGYVWAGWCMNAEGTGTVYGPDYTTTFEITQNTTLYAKWNAKTITGLAYTGTPTATQYDGQAFNPAGLTVTATFNDASQEDVTSDVVWTPNPLTTATTSVTGTYMELTVVVEGITVTYAPGSENNPYTVAQARAAIDAGTGTQGVYATGIVSAIVTPYGTNNYKNITFNMVDEAGDEVFLQAFRCIGDEAPDVAVNDIAVVYGNLTKYQTTYEFASGCSVVSLEHPSTPYITAEDVNITYDATGGNIAYTVQNPVQGGQVTATTTSTWLTLGTDFTSPIAFTCDANEAGERTATVTLTYTYGAKTTVNKEVTVTQAGNPNVFDNIEDITEVGTAYSVKGTVVAINARGFVMGDGTDYVYYYKNAAPTQAVNDMVTVAGTTGTYGQIIQFTSAATVGEATTSNYDGTPAATVITAVPDYSTGYHLSTYLEFTGALEKSSNNYLITIGESQIQISYPTSAQSEALTALNGKTVHVKGYFSGINSSSKFTVMLESAEEVLVPSITLAQYEYNLNADGGDAVLQVTYTNMPANPQAEVIFYEANGTTTATYDWITASINANYNIAGHINVNEGDARSAYFKVKGKDANNNDVYSNLVTINQAAAGATIEFNNTSMTLAAGGESDRQLSFDYSGLGSNPTFSINYYEQDGTTPATYNHDWLTATIEGKKVNISAVANQGAERKAYFKVYGENGAVNTESNLVTITQGEAPTYAELPFSFNGGKADIENTDGLSQEGLGSDYNASSNPTTKLKFDGTGDWLLLQFNERPGTLTFDIKGNSFSGSTFKVQTSEDGISYTDLETYTDLGDTQNESFSNLDENVRYIKWIYTEKSSGNVGLGNIALAEYAAPVASITVTPATVDVTAEGEDDGILPIAYENLTITEATDFDIQYYDANNQPLSKDDEPDWMGAAVQDNATQDGYEVSYFVSENDGEARTAYFKVYALDANMELVYSNLITVSQEAYVAPTATIAVTPETVNVEASGEDEGNLAIAYENLTITDPADFDIQYYDANNQPLSKDDKPDWMEASIIANSTQDGYVVSFSVDPNDGAARTAYFKVYALDGNTEIVYSNLVTINQAEFVVDYAVLPFEFDGGRADIANTNGLTQEGLDSDYGSSPKLKFNTTGDWVILKINETPGVLSFDIKGNSFSGSTFKVQTSEDGETYSDLKTYTELGDTQNESFDNLGENVRYIKWIYTNKDAGNVALGNIALAEPAAPVASITVEPALVEATAEETEGNLAITLTNIEITEVDDHFEVYFCNANGEIITDQNSKPNWLIGEVQLENSAFSLYYMIEENTTSEARTAYMKVYGLGDNLTTEAYSNLVTVTQEAGTAPEYTVTFSVIGTIDDNLTATGSSITLPTTSYLIPEGFTITGWSESNTSTVAVANPYTPTANVTLYAITYQYGEDSFELVTDASDLADGDIVVIAALNSDYAMSTIQNNNNRGQAAIVKSGNQIALSDNVCEFVLGEGSEDDSWSFYDAVNEGYIYAASSSSNWLRTETGLSANSSWTISIEENAATITAQGNYTRNVLQYNLSSSIFSCYASASQQAVCIYKKNAAPSFNIVNTITEPDASMSTNIPETTCVVVEEGAVLTFTGTNEGTAANIVVQEGGQLIHTADVEATVQIGVSGYSNTSKSGDGWYFIASPVDGLATSAVATGTYDLFVYNEPNAYWYSSTGMTAPFTTLERGVGYLYANTSDINLDFAGLMIKTNQNIEMNLSYTEAMGNLKGFNLMGNPFTRNLGTDDMKLGGADVASYYGFDNKGEEIVVRYIDADPIKPGQGFMVQATAANQKLVFNPGAKAESENNGYISIVAGNENGTDNAFIHFGNVNTLRKMTFSGDKSQVYVMNNGDDYAAARLDEAKGLVPVHFEAAGEGMFTITIEAKNLDLETLRLIDNFTGEEIDLLVEPTYTFKANSDEPANRFTLLFEKSTLGIDENDAENEVFAYQSGDEIYFNGEGTLQVFDVMGRFVMSREINGNDHISTSLFNTGVYVFRLVGETVMTQKIVVR